MKKGITFVSLLIYVVMLFTFMIVASSVTTSINRKNFKDKGFVEVNNSYLKLYANMFDSAKNSSAVNYIDGGYAFSNGDFYYFDNNNNLIKKNNGLLCDDFVSISFDNSNKNNSNEYVDFDVEFKSFDNKIKRKIILSVGNN